MKLTEEAPWPVALAAAWLVLWPGAAVAAVEIGPEADFCAELRKLPEGGELVLAPGDYQGPCSIRRGGAPGRPLVIRAADPARRPRIVWSGTTSNAIQIYASHVRLQGLAVGPTQRNVDGVRVYQGEDITVEDCEFTGLGGIAVVANHGSVHGLVVRRNVIRDSAATAMYFGCHDGRGCVVSGLVVERNYIDGVRAPDPEIGYGIQLKLNTTGVVRDNVVVDTKGPGIMVYGAQDPGRASVIERNLVTRALRSSGIVVGGGSATVRNNVSVGNAQAGIALEDYGHRGLLRGIVVAHNTLHGNALGGIRAPDRGLTEVAIAGNAVHAAEGMAPWPRPQEGLLLAGNVDCSRGGCFADPAHLDFSPLPHSPLVTAPRGDKGRWVPADDFLAAPRKAGSIAGAITFPTGPIVLGPKR